MPPASHLDFQTLVLLIAWIRLHWLSPVSPTKSFPYGDGSTPLVAAQISTVAVTNSSVMNLIHASLVTASSLRWFHGSMTVTNSSPLHLIHASLVIASSRRWFHVSMTETPST